jgi:hypothetical protein
VGSGYGGVEDNVMALAVYCGELYEGTESGNVGKWDGTSWKDVGAFNERVYSLAVYNGELYAGGSFTWAEGTDAARIAKWNGYSWSAVGSGLGFFYAGVQALAVYNGELYAGGFFQGGGIGSFLNKWNGSSWSAVDSGMNGYVTALAVYNGELYAGGVFTTAGGIPANRIAKWNGSSWSAVGTGLDNYAGALAIYNGELYAGGYFTIAGGVAANCIAKWNGSSWSAVGTGMNNGIHTLAVYNGELYAGGYFTTAGGIPANRIAKWSNCNALPQPGAITGNTSVCVGSSQTYGVSPINDAINYTWTLPCGWTGTSTTNSIIVTVGPNNGYISVTANNNCGSSIEQILAITVNSNPIQPGLITGSSSVCKGNSQPYSINAVIGATSYTWTLPSGWTGTSTTNSITATAGTNSGNISVFAINSCGISPAQNLAVSVIQNPAQPGSISGSSPVCKGSSQTYSINAVNGATSYAWMLPTGWTGTSTTNSITATAGANGGNISVIAINSCDANSPAQTLAVMVNSTPAQPGSITGNTVLNIGQTFNFSISPVSNVTGYNWSLSGGGNIISGQNTTSISASWLMSGYYTLSVNANNSCGASSNQTLNVLVIDSNNPFQIKVTPNPSPGNFYLTAKGVIDKEMHIEIFNLLGQKIYSDQQRAGTNNYSRLLNLEKVASGVYVVKIIIDNKTYVKTIVKIS